MTRWIEHAAIVLAGLACALLFLLLLRLLTPAREALCRGPARQWYHSLLPWHWFHSPRCDYDLSGSIPDAAGQVICPECGTRQVRSTRRRRPARWRTGRVALVLLLIALPCWKVRWIRSGNWAPYAPTSILLTLEESFPGYIPWTVCDELLSREPGMSQVSRAWLARVAVSELASDEISHNSAWASDVLYAAAPSSIPALEVALRSEDFQQRMLAAMVLMRLADPTLSTRYHLRSAQSIDVDYSPPDNLYSVAVEGLADNSIDWTTGVYGTDADLAFPYLLRNAEHATPELSAGLDSHDTQQKLLCAAIAAMSHHSTLRDRGIEYLCRSLGDDDETENAVFAYQSLWRTGDVVLPQLEATIAAEPNESTQRARTALLLIYRLRGTAITKAESLRLYTISAHNDDPNHLVGSWLIRLLPPLAKGQE
ncbi:MAG: hypothetical protein IT434_12450 [Phycisphaerales bacterium]|jgi:hypothetical protein|nr:hypothetical protein [Phycisphaerales bacterium]